MPVNTYEILFTAGVWIYFMLVTFGTTTIYPSEEHVLKRLSDTLMRNHIYACIAFGTLGWLTFTSTVGVQLLMFALLLSMVFVYIAVRFDHLKLSDMY